MTVHLGSGKYLSSFLISNFRRVLNILCFLLGSSPASELYMPTFRNTLSVPSSQAGGMKCDWRREQLGYLYSKRFDWKIAEPIGGRVTGRGQ